MIRSEVLKALIPVISDKLIVCNIGLPSQELYMLDDQSSNFYGIRLNLIGFRPIITNVCIGRYH